MGISAAIGSLLGEIGIGGVAASIGTAAIEGAALGAVTSGITGGNIGKGALLGGLTGGFGGAASSGLSALGASPGLSSVLGSTIGGAGAAAVTGGDIGKSALIGGAMGALRANLGGTKSTGPAASAGGGTSSAAGTAAPSGVAPASPDVTAPVAGGTSLPGSGGGGAGLPGSIGGGAASGGTGLASGGGTAAGSMPGLGGTSGPDITVTAGPIQPSVPDIGSATGTAFANATAGLDRDTGGGKKGKGVIDSLAANPRMALTGLGLASTALSGNRKPSEYKALLSQAQEAQQRSRQMEGYLASGTLPPAMQASIDAATRSAEATIRSQYANLGMSGSSAEAQDVAAVRERAATQGAQIAMQLYQQGVSEAGLSSQLYTNLLAVQRQDDANISQAIGNFSAALATMGA